MILCGTDFSPESNRASRLACALGSTLGEGVTLLHVIDVPAGWTPEVDLSGMGEALREDAQSSLAAQEGELRAAGFTVQSRIAMGPPADLLLEEGTRAGARFIVLGSHGRGRAVRLLMGSVAERAVRHAELPVLVVPGSVDERHLLATRPSRFLRVVAAVDLTAPGDAVISWVRELRRTTPCDVTFLHLFWPPRELERAGLGYPDDVERKNAQVERSLLAELRRHVGQIPGTGQMDLRVRAIWGEEPSPLGWEAEVLGADLLVVGTAQKGGWGGSTAIGTLRTAAVPVLCIPERDGAGGKVTKSAQAARAG
jgi:nucleotide-binding universal stress UspA family protein